MQVRQFILLAVTYLLLCSANGLFNNLNDRDKAPFRFNQFGSAGGGPVYLPQFGAGGESLYSGKNRIISYEGARQVTPGSSTHTVPTERMRALLQLDARLQVH